MTKTIQITIIILISLVLCLACKTSTSKEKEISKKVREAAGFESIAYFDHSRIWTKDVKCGTVYFA